MDIHSISAVVAAICNIALAGVVFFMAKKNRLTFLFVCLSLLLSLWHIGFLFSYPEWKNIPAMRVMYFGLIWLIPAAFHFVNEFLKKTIPPRKKQVKDFYLFGTGFFLASFTSVFATPVWNIAFVIYCFGVLIYCDLLLYRGYRVSVYFVEKNRIAYVLCAVLLATFSGFTDFSRIFGLPLKGVGNLMNPLYVLIMALAIIRYRLLNIRIYFRRVFSMLMSALLVAMIYGGGLMVIRYHTKFLYLGIFFISVLVILFFQSIKNSMDALSGKIFKERVRLHKALLEFSKDIITVTDMDNWKKALRKRLAPLIHVKHIEILLLSDHTFTAADETLNILQKYPSRLLVPDDRTSLFSEHREVLTSLFRQPGERCLMLLLKIDGTLQGILVLKKIERHINYYLEEEHALNGLTIQIGASLKQIFLIEKIKSDENLRTMGEMSACIAHEIKNPLASIKSASEYLRSKMPPNGKEFLNIIVEEASRLDQVIRKYLQFSRPYSPSVGKYKLNPIIENILGLASKQLEDKKINVEKRLSPLPKISFDPDGITQVIWNLLNNAVDALKDVPGPRIIIFSKRTEHDTIQLTVSNNGHSIPDDKKKSIFEPFQSDKPGGTGLGLALSRRIVEAHKGTIRVTDTDSMHGTSFVIELPVQG